MNENPQSTLLFFDINGTLIVRDDRTDIPYSNAINTLLQTTNAMEGVDTSARSDKDVFIEVLQRKNKAFSEELWKTFLTLYQKELEGFYNSDVWRANADAVPFIHALYQKGYVLALISGELAIGAEFKLKKIGVWDCFVTGGFGEDGLRRFDIADTALRKIKEVTQTNFVSMYVIGDTILDIQTARHLNAKSIAITTGSHSREKLLTEKPDYCIDSFCEIKDLFFSV